MANRTIHMVQVRGETSNRNPRLGLAGGKAQGKMVRFDGETSNTLLDVLEDWHTVLAAEKLDQHPMLRGPRP